MYVGENAIIKSAFHKNKRPINVNEVDIEEIVLPHKNSYIKDQLKYFIGYRNKGNAFESPLYKKLPEMNGYVKYFDKNNKCINLLVNDKETLKKYLEIWDKIKGLFKNDLFNSKTGLFNSKPV